MEKRRYLSDAEKVRLIQEQNGLCACGCGEALVIGEIEFDHKVPLWCGGTNEYSNFQALKRGRGHHGDKTSREAKERAKGNRIIEQGGLLKKKLSKREREMQRRLDYQASRA